MKLYPYKNHTLKTARQHVLWRLYIARKYSEQFHPALPIGFVPMYALRNPDCGDAADVRLRELRRIHKIPIKYKTFASKGWHKIHAYRLNCKPELLDWIEIVKQGPDYRFTGNEYQKPTNSTIKEPVVSIVEPTGQTVLL